jgi:hypothetical protein
MNEKIAALLERIRTLEAEIEEEFAARRKEFGYRVEERVVHFEERIAAAHRALRQSVLGFLHDSDLINILTSPFIYAMIVPLVLLDVALTVYQRACFPGYGIARVERSKYIALDRGRLNYLNFLERLNCDYCAYANGLIAYAREIASRTEQYFCPIKHALKVLGAHGRYAEFLEYGDAEAYRRELETLRAQLRSAAAKEAAGSR